MLSVVSAPLSFNAPVAMASSSRAAVHMTVSMEKVSMDTVSIQSIEQAPMFLDEEASLKAMAFPIDEATLISKSREYLFYNQGVEAPDMLSEDFTFMGPFVGGEDGLSKEAYLSAVGGFNIKAAFPDLNPRFHAFRADALDAGRVWFVSQASGTDNGEGFLGNKPTGKSFSTPPQACSLKFKCVGWRSSSGPCECARCARTHVPSPILACAARRERSSSTRLAT